MSSLYDAYATVTQATSLSHSIDVARTAQHFERYLLPWLKRKGCDLKRSRILEFGAGWGRNLLALQSIGAKDARGVDISAEQVALGRRLGLSSLELVAPDEDLELRLGETRFDLLLAIDVLEHLTLTQLERFAAVAPRLLAPGGLLVVQVPNDLAPFNPVRAGDLTHLRAFTPASLRQFFALAQLEPTLIAGMPFPGKGMAHLVRRVLVLCLVTPMSRLASFALYGREVNPVSFEPNLLGIAQRRRPN
jgi:SAM-dependent methyltransferase